MNENGTIVCNAALGEEHALASVYFLDYKLVNHAHASCHVVKTREVMPAELPILTSVSPVLFRLMKYEKLRLMKRRRELAEPRRLRNVSGLN